MVDFAKIERKWQKKWKSAKAFEADPSNKKKYFLTIPYPYASGPLHIGHGRTYTIGDVFARYKRLKGYNVLFPMAFHVTGTPVLAVSQQIRMGDKKATDQYKYYIQYHETNPKKVKAILDSFKEPKNVMKYFSKVIQKDFELVGFSIDWRRQFTTDDADYNKFIEWQFHNLHKKGYLTQGDFPILFSLDDQNAVGDDDIKDGDTEPVEINEFTSIKFKLKEEDNTYLIASTLRPETIFGLTNMWLNPKVKYVKAQTGKENWIISKEAFEKLGYQKHKFTSSKPIAGSSLIDKVVISPLTSKEVKVLPASFVEGNVGTGIVYSVPASAPYDYLGLKDLQESGKYKDITIIPIIKMDGYSDTPAIELSERNGIKTQKEAEKIATITKEIYAAEFHKGVLNKNCKGYSGRKVSEVKPEIINKMIKNKDAFVFYETNRPALTRAKGKVIVAVLADQWFLHYGNKTWKEKTKAAFKNIKISPEIYRKLFVNSIDWLDKKPVARQRGLGTKLPFDKKWIIESLSDSTIYMAFYTIIHHIRANKIKARSLTKEFWDYVFLAKGSKKEVSKSTGISTKLLRRMKEEFEYWYPNDQRHTATAHISNHLSMMIFNHVGLFKKKYWPKLITANDLLIREGKKMSKSEGNVIPINKLQEKYFIDLFRAYIVYAADLSSNLDWREKDVEGLRGKIQQFYNLVLQSAQSKKKTTIDTSWLLSRFNRNLKKAEEHLDNNQPRQYFQAAFYDMMNDIQYFIRRTGSKDSIRPIITDWIKILSPVMPHMCEEIWSKFGNKSFVSLESWPKVNTNAINDKVESTENAIRKALSDVNQILKITGKKPKKIFLYVVPPDLSNFKSAEEFLTRDLKVPIKIFASNDPKKIDPEGKARKAKPGKPGIYIE